MTQPDIPTPIDQIAPEILNLWDRWIREKTDTSKRYKVSPPAGVTPRVRDRPLIVEMAPNGSWTDAVLASKKGNY